MEVFETLLWSAEEGPLRNEPADGKRHKLRLEQPDIDMTLLRTLNGGAPAPLPPSNPVLVTPVVQLISGDSQWSATIDDSDSQNHDGIRVFEDGVQVAGSPFAPGTTSIGPFTGKANAQAYQISIYTYRGTAQSAPFASTVTPQDTADGELYALLTPARLSAIQASIAADASTKNTFDGYIAELVADTLFKQNKIYTCLLPQVLYLILNGTDSTVEQSLHDDFMASAPAMLGSVSGLGLRVSQFTGASKPRDAYRAHFTNILMAINWYERYLHSTLAIFTAGELATIRNAIVLVLEEWVGRTWEDASWRSGTLNQDSDETFCTASSFEAARRYIQPGDGASGDLLARITDACDDISWTMDRGYFSPDGGVYAGGITTSTSYNGSEYELALQGLAMWRDRGGVLVDPLIFDKLGRHVQHQIFPGNLFTEIYNDLPRGFASGAGGDDLYPLDTDNGYAIYEGMMGLLTEAGNQTQHRMARYRVAQNNPSTGTPAAQWQAPRWFTRLFWERAQWGAPLDPAASGEPLHYWEQGADQALGRSDWGPNADHATMNMWPQRKTHHHSPSIMNYNVYANDDVVITKVGTGAGTAYIYPQNMWYVNSGNNTVYGGMSPSWAPDRNRGPATIESFGQYPYTREVLARKTAYGDASAWVARVEWHTLFDIDQAVRASYLTEGVRSILNLWGAGIFFVYDICNDSVGAIRVRRFNGQPSLAANWYSAIFDGYEQKYRLFDFTGVVQSNQIYDENNDEPYASMSSNNFYPSQRRFCLWHSYAAGEKRTLEVCSYAAGSIAAPTVEDVTINAGHVDAKAVLHGGQWYVLIFNRSYQPIVGDVSVTLGASAVVSGARLCAVGFDDGTPFLISNPSGKTINLTANAGSVFPNSGHLMEATL